MIFMGLALVHFQKYWLLRAYMWEKQVKLYRVHGNFLQMIKSGKKVKIVKHTCTYKR